MASMNWEIGPGELKRRPFKRTRENGGPLLVMILALAGFDVALWKWLYLLQDGVISRLFRGQIVSDDELLGLVVTSVAVVGLLGLFMSAPRWAYTRRELAIDGTSVMMRCYFLHWLQWEWTEPLANYQGVLFAKMEVSGGKNSPPKTYFVPELHHADADKCIRLCQDRYTNRQETEGGGEYREKWEAYAEALNLPALEQPDKKGPVIRRDADTLDMSIVEQVRTGHLDGAWEKVPSPPKGLRAFKDGDGVTIAVPNPHYAPIKRFFAGVAAVGGVVCVMGLLGAVLFFSSSPMPVAFIGFCICAVGLGACGLTNIQLTAETRIKLTKNAVDVCWVNSLGSNVKAICMRLDDLEEMRLILNGKVVGDSSTQPAKVPAAGRPGLNRLALFSDKQYVDVAFPSPESADWTYHYILTTTARQGSDLPIPPAQRS